MPSIFGVERQLLQILRDKLIPWASGTAALVLIGAPPRIIGSVSLREEMAAPLPILKGAGLEVHVQVWRNENLNSMTVPYLGCVVDGEADLVTATTAAMCQDLQIEGKRWIITAPAKTFLLTPPRIPISGGERPHWERSHPENANSRILWMQFHATGISWHFCTTDQGKHWSHPHYFISGVEFLPLAQKLIHEMKSQSPQYLPLAYHYLSILFLQMVREIQTKTEVKCEQQNVSCPMTPSERNDPITQRAIRYIEANLNSHSLSVAQIADYLQLSSRHLARIFRRDTGSSLLTWIIERRMILACQHLTQSQYTITKIAGHVGYATSSSFVKAFQRQLGVSPTAYRSSHQCDVGNEQQMADLDSRNHENS